MTIKIFVIVYLAMISASLWESAVEGRDAWGKKKYGWKIEIMGFHFTSYHFWLFGVMFPALLSLPLVVKGWDSRLFGIMLSSYLTGLVV